MLQAGDRILSINGYPCDQCSVDEVSQLLNDAYCSGQVGLLHAVSTTATVSRFHLTYARL